MRGAALAAAVLLSAACAGNKTLHSCAKRDFEPVATEEAEKALAERLAAAKARGRERWTQLKRLDPEYPSAGEKLVAERHWAHAQTCWRYGWYDEALDEYQTAAAVFPDR